MRASWTSVGQGMAGRRRRTGTSKTLGPRHAHRRKPCENGGRLESCSYKLERMAASRSCDRQRRLLSLWSLAGPDRHSCRHLHSRPLRINLCCKPTTLWHPVKAASGDGYEHLGKKKDLRVCVCGGGVPATSIAVIKGRFD